MTTPISEKTPSASANPRTGIGAPAVSRPIPAARPAAATTGVATLARAVAATPVPRSEPVDVLRGAAVYVAVMMASGGRRPALCRSLTGATNGSRPVRHLREILSRKAPNQLVPGAWPLPGSDGGCSVGVRMHPQSPLGGTMDSDRSDQLARSQQARSTAAQLQSRLVAVARGLTDSYEEAARQHEQSAVNRRPPTEVDHLADGEDLPGARRPDPLHRPDLGGAGRVCGQGHAVPATARRPCPASSWSGWCWGVRRRLRARRAGPRHGSRSTLFTAKAMTTTPRI